jgi:hypothetical protein
LAIWTFEPSGQLTTTTFLPFTVACWTFAPWGP